MLLIEILKWWFNPWNFLSGIMSAVALLGTIYNAERNKFGFVFWLISNLYMAVRFFVIGEYAQMVLFFTYFLLAIKGLAVWCKKDEEDEKNKSTAKKVKEYISRYK